MEEELQSSHHSDQMQVHVMSDQASNAELIVQAMSEQNCNDTGDQQPNLTTLQSVEEQKPNFVSFAEDEENLDLKSSLVSFGQQEQKQDENRLNFFIDNDLCPPIMSSQFVQSQQSIFSSVVTSMCGQDILSRLVHEQTFMSR